MNLRRMATAATLTLGLTALGLGLTSTPASAAPSPVTAYVGGQPGTVTACATAGNVGIFTDAAHTTAVTTITGTVGNMTVTNDCTDYAIYLTAPGGGTSSIPGTSFNGGAYSSSSVGINASGTLDVYRCAYVGVNPGTAGGCTNPSDRTLVASITVTVTGGGGGGGGGGAVRPSSGIAPVFQQFGMPQSLTCEAAAPASLNWAGVASGGWSQSWAQWMNGGLGGAVCTRTLVYSTLQGAWVVA